MFSLTAVSDVPNLFKYRHAAGSLWVEDLDTRKKAVRTVYARNKQWCQGEVCADSRNIEKVKSTVLD